MKKNLFEFIRRGLSACGFGPLILAVVYRILQLQGIVQTLTVDQVCVGIFSITALAFVAGGMNFLYQIERLPLMAAILLHGGVLYVGYLATYLVNDWLEWGAAPILVFSGIFVGGYLAIWAVIYSVIRRRTAKLNEILKKKQQSTAEEG
jgi:branched-subunit amino acid ABC-type transport system permease component